VERHRVSQSSTVLVRNNCYSVPSQLIGEWVEVRVYGEQLEIWFAKHCLQQMERLRGRGQALINYRHLIHSLIRKPGAFAHDKYQASLFPRLIFRMAWDELQHQSQGSGTQEAAREYLAILHLAATQSEELTATVLQQLLDRSEPVSSHRVRQLMMQLAGESASPIPGLLISPIPLVAYDLLLEASPTEEVLG
jgi:hypothetical protein